MLFSASDIANIHHIPCFRNAILYGIASGVILGTIRIIFHVPIIKACHTCVITFCCISIVSWEGCRYQRYIEKRNIKMSVDNYPKETKIIS
ncbi:hypothetical protein PNEG_02966 [Pneumocystis murina B123]|uniref:Cytochrome c oxidase assembly protein COX20, mitochondrial n=1 Tax=Pneumocystis murina (strain B123) TaxID=1069680 RepID=M7NNX5_PNEMU|nr:hypothetical protein PNEG_02966 [Pneumocystis murina B123]EMR08796.1 hypothetical protein PNEG_02966 [Pneumocystis murina B123]